MEENQTVQPGEHVKCIRCGADMVYDPEAGKMKCPYCGARQAVENGGAVREHDFREEEEPGPRAGSVVVRCRNCGAEMTLGPDTAADFCAFCGSPLVARSDGKAAVPEAVVPFRIPRADAEARFRRWIRSRFFAPVRLRTGRRSERLTGVYVPHFTYDCRTLSSYTGEAGAYPCTAETGWAEESGRATPGSERRISWRPVRGRFEKTYDDVLVNASHHVDLSLLRLNFNLRAAVRYKPDYLCGFLAENTGMDVQTGWEAARERIDEDLRASIAASVGADEMRGLEVNTDYSERKFKELLLPVWMSAYIYRGKTYRFIINGETGEIRGRAPVSRLRVGLGALLAVGVPGVLFYFSTAAGLAAFVVTSAALVFLLTRRSE